MIDKQYERQALFRRLRLFGFGLVLGCICVYFMLWRGKDLGFWTPGQRVLETIRLSKMTFLPRADCMMKCLNVSQQELKELFDKKGMVEYFDVHQKCPVYIIHGKDGNNLNVKLSSCDSVVTVMEVHRENQNDCPDCK